MLRLVLITEDTSVHFQASNENFLFPISSFHDSYSHEQYLNQFDSPHAHFFCRDVVLVSFLYGSNGQPAYYVDKIPKCIPQKLICIII